MKNRIKKSILSVLLVSGMLITVACGKTLNGTYYLSDKDYFRFESDGTVTNSTSGRLYYGTYKIKGNKVTVNIGGFDYPLKISGDKLINNDDGSVFVKK